MDANKVLIINLGWEQEPLIDLLASKGYRLYGVHYNTDYYKGVKFEEVEVCDLRDLEKILSFAKKVSPDAVISDSCDYSHFAQAIVCEALGLRGPKLIQAQVSANKLLQRNRAKEKGVLVPDYALAQCVDDVKNFISEFGYPVIVKPVDNRGSFGVGKIETEREVNDAYFKAVANSHSRLILVEKFIEGYEITVDGYCFNGKPTSLALAKKNKGDKKVQVSMDIRYPGDLPAVVYEKALANNEFVNSVLGYTFGMTHSEYMVDANNDIYLIESANRGGGVYTSEIIVPNVSEVDILEAYANDILNNERFPQPNTKSRNNVILKFFSFNSGNIKAIDGVKELLADERVMKFRLAVKEGDTIAPITSDANRHGFIIVKAKEDVSVVADNLINTITITYS